MRVLAGVCTVSLTVVVWVSVIGAAQQQQARVIADAPVMLYPDANRTPLVTLKPGTVVQVLDRTDDWVHVSFRDGSAGERVGYIRTGELRIDEARTATQSKTEAPAEAPAPHEASEITNDDIVQMVSSQLSDDVIVSAIQQAKSSRLDVSPQALIRLRHDGASDRIIQAVQQKAAGMGAPHGSNAAPSPGNASKPCRIFVTEEEPASDAYVVVRKEVQVGKKWYGTKDDALMTELATQANKVGADAIIKYHEWRAPSMWSWAAAKEGGMAVKWTPKGQVLVSTMKGQCWSPKAR